VKGRGLKGSRKSIFVSETSSPQRGERGKAFILSPKKLAIGNKLVETGTSSFGIRTSGF
jgi:hypothetical protein